MIRPLSITLGMITELICLGPKAFVSARATWDYTGFIFFFRFKNRNN